MKHAKYTPGFVLLATALALHAQTYNVDWHTIAGGGGSSSGGTYTISGTIGQPAAGPLMTGGAYSISGGFWTMEAVPSPGAPLLQITLTSTNTALVWWPSASAGFALEVTTTLISPTWGPPSQIILDNGTIKYIVVNPPAGNQFFRLKQ